MGWFLYVLISVTRLKTIQLFTLLGSCVNIDVEMPTDQEIWAHSRQVLVEIENFVTECIRGRTRGPITQAITKADEPMVIATFSKDL